MQQVKTTTTTTQSAIRNSIHAGWNYNLGLPLSLAPANFNLCHHSTVSTSDPPETLQLSYEG